MVLNPDRVLLSDVEQVAPAPDFRSPVTLPSPDRLALATADVAIKAPAAH